MGSSETKGKFYGYTVTHQTRTHGDGDDEWTKRKYGKKGASGDVIDMTLDLEKYELIFAVNDKTYGVAFEVQAQTTMNRFNRITKTIPFKGKILNKLNKSTQTSYRAAV